MEKKYGMVIDVAKCTGCCNCFLACKDENCNEEHEGYTAAQPDSGQKWMDEIEIERGQFPKVKLTCVPLTCNHCDNPGCMTKAQDGAVYKREDGIVIIDPVKAKGQKEIVNTCPYRRIFWNEALQLPQKCDMCAHLLDKGYKEPRCVEMCPTGALTFGDLNDPDSEVSKLMAGEEKPEALHPEYGMNDRVLYLHYPKNFLAGTVVFKETDQCAEGVRVSLESKDGSVKAETVTDNFGDFWFDGLESNIDFKITIEMEHYKPLTCEKRTLKSYNLGEFFIERED